MSRTHPRPAGPNPPAVLRRAWRRYRPSNWRLRTKLAAILVVPLLLVGTLGSLRVAASSQDAADLDALVRQVTAGQDVARLVDAVQDERRLAQTWVAADRAGGRRALDDAVARVDAAAAPVTARPPGRFGPAAGDIEAAARVRLADLPALRRAVTGSLFPAERVGTAYTAIIDVLRTLQDAALTAAPPALLREAADAVTVADAKELVGRQHATISAVLVGGSATPALQEAATAASAQLAATLARLDTAALPATRSRFTTTVAGADVDNRRRIEQRVLTAVARGEPLPPLAAEWDGAASRATALIRDVEAAQQQQLATDGAALAGAARAAAWRDGVVLAVLVLLTVAVLAVVVRSLVRPLRTLRTSALRIAHLRLPESIAEITHGGGVPPTGVRPIGVETDEEIGEVARAFDAVHTAAVRLAGEQAMLRRSVNASLANLARRSQGIVTRQRDLLGLLEAREPDADRRGDLVKVDHLAIRMRRTNENLLVLAGEADPRPAETADAALPDVLAAAVAEIELGRMVTVGPAPDVVVRGPVVVDLAHMLAELLENATMFTPLDSAVLLDATIGPDRDLVVEVVDSGSGIPSAELTKINADLADPPRFDTPHRMGLVVVGRLAGRHGITVALRRPSHAHGLVASVTVPAAQLAAPARSGDQERPSARR